MQSPHEVLTPVATNLPTGQSVHATLPAPVTYCPAAQFVQVVVPVPAANLPGVQLTQSVTAPSVPMAVPAAHGVHAELPLSLAYFPVSQSAQLLAIEPVSAKAFPATHFWHACVVSLYWPAAQAVHAEAPSIDEKVPAAHTVQRIAPAGRYWPAAHTVHELEPAAVFFLPAAQIVHVGMPNDAP